MGSSTLEIGSRIHCDGEYGTVLYIGPIEGIEGKYKFTNKFLSIFRNYGFNFNLLFSFVDVCDSTVFKCSSTWPRN